VPWVMPTPLLAERLAEVDAFPVRVLPNVARSLSNGYDSILSCRNHRLLGIGASDSHLGHGVAEPTGKLGAGFDDLLDLIGVIPARAYKLKSYSNPAHEKADTYDDWSRRHIGCRGSDCSGDVA
jgi:hypothetical protein